MQQQWKISRSNKFRRWLKKLPKTNLVKIEERLRNVEEGNFGDCKYIQKGVYELRFYFGQGYRIYYKIEKATVRLLCGGNKTTQKRDIKYAMNR